MKLQKKFFDIIIYKNRNKYLVVLLSIIIGYIAATFFTIYIDNVLLIYSRDDFPQYHHIYNNIRAVFIISLVFFASYQYYNVMKISRQGYFIFITNRATRRQIRILIFFQILFLLFITITIGLFIGYHFSNILVNYADIMLIDTSFGSMLNSDNTFSLISIVISSIIIVLAIDMDRTLWKSIDIEEGKRHYIS